MVNQANSFFLPRFLGELKTSWPILLALLVMYAPTFYHLTDTVWKHDDNSHGPLVVAIVIYLFWFNRQHFKLENPDGNVLGWLFMIIGLFAYTVGRSQEVIIFDVGSIFFVAIGIILITSGVNSLKSLWFPVFFIIFIIPLPVSLIDSITLPMKVAVSYVATNLLHWLDYPIARSGVVIQIAQFKLLVADACAGMNTLISLEALGLLYLNLVKSSSIARNVLLGCLIVPISFTANVVRVIVLILVTYYFGAAAGQGFIHGFAGMVLFIVALFLIIFVDSLIQWIVNKFFSNELKYQQVSDA